MTATGRTRVDGEADLREVLGDAETYAAFQIVRKDALDRMVSALDRDDHAELVELYEAWSWDLTLLPSTPAWNGMAGGRLAVVRDRIVFFAERLWGGTAVRFVMRGTDVIVKHRSSALLGLVDMKLRDAHDHRRVVLTPPRYVKLTEVSIPAEEPGWSEVVRELRDGMTGLFSGADTAAGVGDSLGDVADLAGELFSMVRSYRVARVHHTIWVDVLARLAAGETAPFVAHTGVARSKRARKPAAAPRPAARRRSPSKPVRPASTGRGGTPDRADASPSDSGSLAAVVEAQTGLSAEQAAEVIDLLAECIHTELAEQGQSRVPKLGTFVVTTRSVSFRPNSAFRSAVEAGR